MDMRALQAFRRLIAGILVGMLFVLTRPVLAQAVLVSATPAPGAVLVVPPDRVILAFSRAIGAQGTWLYVTTLDGERVDQADMGIDPYDRAVISVSLPPLPEGQYRVVYNIMTPGDSVITNGQYEFTVDYPDPTLQISSPLHGQSFSTPTVQIDFVTEYFDFSRDNNRIHIYLDDILIAEARSNTFVLGDLSAGVHTIEAVLARQGAEELPMTRTGVTIAIAQPDPELEGREQAAAAQPDTGLVLSRGQLFATVSLVAVLLGTGVVLGYISRNNR
jgi:methionine-rich copper-binding protein CopC